MPSLSRRLLLQRLLILLALASPLHALATNPLDALKNERPAFDPQKYFEGHTCSWGVLESRSGAPTQVLRTETWGHRRGAELRFEQDLSFASGKKQHRSWLLHRVDQHHYTATGTGIIGTAHGETVGNTFHLEFTLDALPGNPLGRVHMAQWLYLQRDGVTLINRGVISKVGVTLAEVTEQFRKLR
jgi:hypothetical protein